MGWEQRLTADDLRRLTPLIYSHISPYDIFPLDIHTRLDLEPPVDAPHAIHEQDAAKVIHRTVRSSREARTEAQQLALFHAAPQPHR